RSANTKGWSLTQELLWRLRSSYKRQRDEERRPRATRALCFLTSEIAERVGFFEPSEWHRSPFAFRAFCLAAWRLFKALEPVGEARNPYELFSEGSRKTVSAPLKDEFEAAFKTPEKVADFTAKGLMDESLKDEFEAAFKTPEKVADFTAKG